jgi:hypothetical protein
MLKYTPIILICCSGLAFGQDAIPALPTIQQASVNYAVNPVQLNIAWAVINFASEGVDSYEYQ